MTGRELLSRRKRWLSAALLGAAALLVLGLVLLQGVGEDVALFVVIAAFGALLALALVGQGLAFRCPWCRANLGTLVMHRGFLRVDPKVRFCPFCGAALDGDVTADAPADARDRWDDPVE